MKTDDIFAKILSWINFKILPNPSGQNQVADHFLPAFFVTTLLVSIPRFGVYAGLLCVAFSLFKEFVEDEHWRDFFSNTESGADGRIDLVFRLAGSGFAYLPILWRCL